jgi:hypothetical protein
MIMNRRKAVAMAKLQHRQYLSHVLTDLVACVAIEFR